MKRLVQLNSVGSSLDTVKKVVYPQMKNGTPDLDSGVKLDNVTMEWFKSLDNDDYDVVVSVLRS